MMNDFAQRMREQQSGPGEVEMMVTAQAWTAQSFDGRRRFATFRAERRLEPNQAGPTFRTCPSPPALQNRSMTNRACAWEQEIEDVVEQSAFGETQRAFFSIAKTRSFGTSKLPGLLGIWKIVDDGERAVDLFKQQHPCEVMSKRER